MQPATCLTLPAHQINILAITGNNYSQWPKENKKESSKQKGTANIAFFKSVLHLNQLLNFSMVILLLQF
jgi:hypothetical protein